MKPQMTRKTDWLEVDTDNGIWWVPTDVVDRVTLFEVEELSRGKLNKELDAGELSERAGKEIIQYTDGNVVDTVKITRGYGVRLSMPGYLDCSEWSVHSNKRSAIREARKLER